MKRILIYTSIVIIAIYLFLCGFLYFAQEKMIFFPEKLEKSYQFQFDGNFEELYFKTGKQTKLHGLLFKADSCKGLIFFLHGNAGTLKSWGNIAKSYTDLDYDIFILDYPGFGKSEGEINGQVQLFSDIQTVYADLTKNYVEENVVVLGYSIGTGMAAKLASTNKPKMLILQAPYYSLTDMMKETYPIVPTFLLKYKFETHKYLKDCSMPVVVFHGDKDEVIYYGSSLKLKEQFKIEDRLITLKGQGHNGVNYNPDYRIELERILK